MKQHLPRCHRHLQTRKKNGSAGVRRARTRRRRHFVPPPLASLPSPSPSPPRTAPVPVFSSPSALPLSTRPGSGWDPRLESPKGTPPTRPGPGGTGTQRRGRRSRSARGRSTDLRQSKENAGGLDELAAQDAQVRLAGQVEPVLHGRGGREPLLRNQRVVDGERNFRVQAVAD